MKNLENV